MVKMPLPCTDVLLQLLRGHLPHHRSHPSQPIQTRITMLHLYLHRFLDPNLNSTSLPQEVITCLRVMLVKVATRAQTDSRILTSSTIRGLDIGQTFRVQLSLHLNRVHCRNVASFRLLLVLIPTRKHIITPAPESM